jgi:translation initiation factor 2B subunit (eIF-2B alpha/beta/delta family)
MPTPVVTCVLRNGAEVLLLRRSDAVGSYPGLWGGVAGHAEGDPDAAARAEVREETGIDPDTLAFVRAGDPFEVRDEGGEWLVHPYLFDCPTRAVELDWETDRYEWVPPTELLRRETVPELWTSYDRVRPRAGTVADDTEHGAAYLSVRALEVLRDEAALAAVQGTDSDLRALARDLATARPSMPVVANRVDRAVHDAAGFEPGALERAADAAIERALRADERAAAGAAERVGDRVATLSRSGTVRATLELAEPAAVLVAESRPGGEGVAVAEQLAETLDAEVALTGDAAFPHQLLEWGADTLLVGADAVLPDGRVVNKAGTRGAALSAADAGTEVVVATSVDKVSRDGTVDLEPRDPAELYAGDRLDVRNPTFDVTPADAVALVGEDGAFDPAETAALHRRHGAWRADDTSAGDDGVGDS